MTYLEDIEKLLSSFSEEQKSALISRLKLNLCEPEQIPPYNSNFKKTRRRIKEIERKALKKLKPEVSYPDPGGPECSHCGLTENEVEVMAKHDSGFNICNDCVELCLKVLREKGIE